MSPNKDVLSVTNSPVSRVWKEGAQIEADVFIEKGYVSEMAELSEEYAKYMPATEFAVVERSDKVVGSTRLIHYRPETGFKTLDDIHHDRLTVTEGGRKLLAQLALEKTFEVGTLAADKQTRSRPEDDGRVAMALYGIIYGEGIRHGCDNVLASFDEEYLNRFKFIFGSGVQTLGPATDYMGSPTVPVAMNLPSLYDNLGTFPGAQESVSGFANIVRHD